MPEMPEIPVRSQWQRPAFAQRPSEQVYTLRNETSAGKTNQPQMPQSSLTPLTTTQPLMEGMLYRPPHLMRLRPLRPYRPNNAADFPQRSRDNWRRVLPNEPEGRVCIQLGVFGKQQIALIDSGSRLNIAPAKLFYPRDIKPPTPVLTAANGSKLEILGTVRMKCVLNGV